MLQDLSKLVAPIREKIELFRGIDMPLPNDFKNAVKSIGNDKITYGKYSSIITNSAGQHIFFCNNWFYIASTLSPLFKPFEEYRVAINQIVDKEVLKSKDKLMIAGAIDRNTTYGTTEKEYLKKFGTDCGWWTAGATNDIRSLDRADCLDSAVLAIANVVNASQSYIAVLWHYFGNNPQIAAMLIPGFESNLASKATVIAERTLTTFIYRTFRVLENEDKLTAFTPYVQESYSRNNGDNATIIKLNSNELGIKLIGLFIETTPSDIQQRNTERATRWFEEPFTFVNRQVFLSNQWNSAGDYQLTFPALQKFIDVCYKGKYHIEKTSDNQYFLFLITEPPLTEFYEPDIILHRNNNPLQQIYYGAPGTGKSFEINLLTKDKEVIRTTFHPDSDYSTFVGAYKPTSIEIPVRDVTGKVIVENGKQVTENRIVYEFVEQAFLQAYTNAWKAYAETAAGENAKEQYLIIEEINRGNCAQIFGDLFQLLDRNRYGFSDYPITADKDMKKQLAKAFKDLTIANADRINKIYGKDIVSQVLNGEVLLLPDNLYIWATMNTSDQSLFPIDSAFKRRWDWKYMPICEGKENGVSLNWKIKTKTNTYDWWQFVEKINAEINEQTKSEDKKLGYFFCKADSGEITAETFVSKVVFYLWNDVFKDQSLASDIFQDGEEELTFAKFYDVDANGKAVVREDKVELFLQNLGVEIVTSNKEDGLIEIDDLDENNVPDNTRNSLKAIEFPDGTVIESTSGAFDAYIRAIEKIGIEKVTSVSDRLKYRRLGRPLISKEKYDEFEGTGYSYIMKEDYYFLKGAKTYTYVRILEDLNELLQLGITIRN